MQRRDFLSKALTGAAAGTVLTACRPQSQGPAIQSNPIVQWRLASSFPRSLDVIYGGAEVLAERLKVLTDDRFRIRCHSAGELVPPLQVLDSVQQGTVQVAHTCSYYFTGKHEALAFDTCVPFGLSSRQQTAWLTQAGGLELMNELFAAFNIMSFPGGNTGVQMGGWFQREINSLADMSGLKMRIPGMGGKVMDRLGVAVQLLAGGDIYPALERGAIDATEWVGPYDDEKLGFYKVAKLYYYPGWWEPGPSLSFYVNREAWTQLPKTYQEAFRTAAAEAALTMQAQYDARNPAALERLLAAGVQMKPFPEDVLVAAHRESFALMEELAAADVSYRKVYDAWKKFRAESFKWFNVAELAYQNFAFSRG